MGLHQRAIKRASDRSKSGWRETNGGGSRANQSAYRRCIRKSPTGIAALSDLSTCAVVSIWRNSWALFAAEAASGGASPRLIDLRSPTSLAKSGRGSLKASS